MIAIIDYEMGNIRSLQNALEFLGAESSLTRDPKKIVHADRIILPGVGAYDLAMKNLRKFGLLPILNDAVLTKKKNILGICLGMQLLAVRGEENAVTHGLGWIKGSIKKIKTTNKSVKLPHIGFNSIEMTKKHDALFNGISDHADFYFIHSYAFFAEEEDDVLSRTHYGTTFVSSVHKNNIYGTQFHPEKSQSNGLLLLKNFICL